MGSKNNGPYRFSKTSDTGKSTYDMKKKEDSNVYFPIKTNFDSYNKTLYDDRLVFMHESPKGILFVMSYSEKEGVSHTVDFKYVDTNSYIKTILLNSKYLEKFYNMYKYFGKTNFYMYGYFYKGNINFYSISLNTNILDTEDTFDIFAKFNVPSPALLYEGTFSENVLKHLVSNNGPLLIRSDYTKTQPKVSMSRVGQKAKKKISKEDEKDIIKKTTEFVENISDELYKCCLEYILDYTGNDFVGSFMREFFESYYEQFQFSYNIPSNSLDYAYSLLNKKIGFKVRSITEE